MVVAFGVLVTDSVRVDVVHAYPVVRLNWSLVESKKLLCNSIGCMIPLQHLIVIDKLLLLFFRLMELMLMVVLHRCLLSCLVLPATRRRLLLFQQPNQLLVLDLMQLVHVRRLLVIDDIGEVVGAVRSCQLSERLTTVSECSG